MADAVRTLSKDRFDAATGEGVTLVDFWADWCAPCRRVAPVVARLAEDFEGRALVAKVNVDDEPELARRFDIRSIPALVIYRDGEVVDQLAGARPYEAIAERLERALSKA
ncbi:MAG: thioredoxin [Myxococcota bacterium]|nr:thioredoxin [Myxococcota bacterium]